MFEIDGFRFSHHALQRALDMQLDPNKIRNCLERPELIKQCRKRPEFDLYYRDDITCSVARGTGVVATILWRSERLWAKDLKYRRGYGGRTWRGDTA